MASDSSVRLAGWTSSERRDIYVKAYRTAQELWGAPVDDLEIPTRFGTTHALVSGPPDAQPLFLLHSAFNTGAIQWSPMSIASLGIVEWWLSILSGHQG